MGDFVKFHQILSKINVFSTTAVFVMSLLKMKYFGAYALHVATCQSWHVWWGVGQCRSSVLIFSRPRSEGWPHHGRKRNRFLTYLLPSVGPWADPGVLSVSPQVIFKSSPGSRLPLLSTRPAVTVLWPVPSYTAWWQRHISVNNLPKVVTQLCPSGNWTHDLLITSPMA